MHNISGHNWRTYRTVVFDCDGVILDSNSLKTAGIRHAVAGYPDAAVNQLIQFHFEHGGVSRRDKFTYFFQHTLGCDPSRTAELVEQSVARYERFLLSQLPGCSEIDGIRRFLSILASYNTTMIVVSGAEEEEVQTILEHRQLATYFTAICGSPLSKVEHLSRLLKQGLLEAPSLFFGDASTDLAAAKQFDMEFVYVSGKSTWPDGLDVCSQEGWSVIDDFREIVRAV